MSIRIATVVGARPQFVKAGAVSRAIRATEGLDEYLIHTGQHFDRLMSDAIFEDLELHEPKYNLGISSLSHGAMTGRMLENIEQILLDDRPDVVLVYGDTNSTLAGALAAVKLHIPVAHIEAGLRSFNRRMPEEINRIATDHVATLQFCPTAAAVQNLANEGILDNVHNVGDVMYDATLFAIEKSQNRRSLRDQLGLHRGPMAVCTIHRAENTDDVRQLGRVCDYLQVVAAEMNLVLPLHPRTRQALERLNLSIPGAHIVEPLGYLDLQALLSEADLVLTDSGGLQKEAYFHGKPCITLRDETEWVETITHGWNRLWSEPDYAGPRTVIDDYGDGRASEMICSAIQAHLS